MVEGNRGTEALVNFLGGDPDKPVIVGQLYNEVAEPAALNRLGNLPASRYLSGLKSREIRAGRSNQSVNVHRSRSDNSSLRVCERTQSRDRKSVV